MGYGAGGYAYKNYWETDPEVEANKKKAEETRAAFMARQPKKTGSNRWVETAFGRQNKPDTPELQAALAAQKENMDAAAKLRAEYESKVAAEGPSKGVLGLSFAAAEERLDASDPAVQAALKARAEFDKRNPAVAAGWVDKLQAAATGKEVAAAPAPAMAAAAPAAAPSAPVQLTENQKKAFPGASR